MIRNNEDHIGLYFRGYFIKINDLSFNLDDLKIRFKLLNEDSKHTYKLFEGWVICSEQPTNNVQRLVFERDLNNNPITFKYPIYLFEFISNEDKLLFCCFPDINMVNYVFPKINVTFYKFDLLGICSNFYLLNNPPSIKLNRLNGKLNYNNDDSVTSISLFGKNNLQSNVIRKLLHLYSDSETASFENPFEKEPPLLEPKSCRLTWSDSINGFSLNVDSLGNFSFLLNNINQFAYLDEILNFIINSKALVYTPISPLKRTALSLQKVEDL